MTDDKNATWQFLRRSTARIPWRSLLASRSDGHEGRPSRLTAARVR
jgi:hypothetical protein